MLLFLQERYLIILKHKITFVFLFVIMIFKIPLPIFMSDIANASSWNSKNFLFSGMASKNLKNFLEFFQISSKTQKICFFQKKHFLLIFFFKRFFIKKIFQ